MGVGNKYISVLGLVRQRRFMRSFDRFGVLGKMHPNYRSKGILVLEVDVKSQPVIYVGFGQQCDPFRFPPARSRSRRLLT